MDSDVLKIEEIVMAGGESEATDLSASRVEQQYAAIIIQEPTPPPTIQPYQHESLQCFQCFITFCNSKAKERHMKKSHREEYKQQLQQCDTLFTCYVCDRTFPSSEELTQHQSTHNKEDKPFKCVHCRESFRTFSELTTHRRQVCPERQFTCKECNQTFRSPALLRNHRVAQHPAREEEEADQAGKTYRCAKCGRGFEEESELLTHQENHAGDQNCNGASPVKKRGRPPKVEPVCAESKPKRTKTEEQTAKSETEKPDDNPAPPSEPESKNRVPAKRGRPPKQEEKPELATAAATEDNPLLCSECDQAFPSLSHLRAHKKEKHTQRKAHACQECEESFNRAEQLEAHVTRVHTAGRHACPTCGKSFSRESNLKAHQQSHDKEEEKPGGRGKR